MGFFVVSTSALAIGIALSPGSSDDWVLDGLNSVISILLCALVGLRIQLGVKNRYALVAWIAALVVTAVLGLTQWTGEYVDRIQDALHLEDADDIGLWFVVPIGLLIAGRCDRIGKFPMTILWFGFFAQSASTLLDLLDGWLTFSVGYDSDLMEMLVNFSEFVFLQAYLVGLTVFVASICVARQMGDLALRPDPLAVGTLGRRLFNELDLFAAARFPRHAIAHWPGARYIIEGGRFALWFGLVGREARRRFGKSLNAQFQEIIYLMLRDGLDAQAYYMMELCRDGRLAHAGQYLSRYETKNGLFKALHRMLPKHGQRRTKLGDKIRFVDMCEAANIPVIPIFAGFENGVISWRIDDLELLDCDLFVKLARGKGARGALWLERVDRHQYLGPDDIVSSLDEVLSSLQASSFDGPIILQPRVSNHANVADFASDSLVVVRVMTCLDQNYEPQITHGLLRILGKLEPTWPTGAEFGAPVDIITGRLGALVGDKINGALDSYRDHPVLGTRVEGTTLPYWEGIKNLALDAHRTCRGRLLVGWDIAITTYGLFIVEGNALPDVAFLQRAHRAPIGSSPLGPLLTFHLGRLESKGKK